jgi:hypothetical protein
MISDALNDPSYSFIIASLLGGASLAVLSVWRKKAASEA